MLPIITERLDEFHPSDILTIIISAKNPMISKNEVKRGLITLGLQSIKKIISSPQFDQDKVSNLIAYETIKAIKYFVYKDNQKQFANKGNHPVPDN